jgi:hypothetical protein
VLTREHGGCEQAAGLITAVARSRVEYLVLARSAVNDDDEQGRISRVIVQIKNTIPKIATDLIQSDFRHLLNHFGWVICCCLINISIPVPNIPLRELFPYQLVYLYQRRTQRQNLIQMLSLVFQARVFISRGVHVQKPQQLHPNRCFGSYLLNTLSFNFSHPTVIGERLTNFLLITQTFQRFTNVPYVH